MDTNLKSEKKFIRVKLTAESNPGLRFNAGIVQILVLFDLFLNFLDLVVGHYWLMVDDSAHICEACSLIGVLCT